MAYATHISHIAKPKSDKRLYKLLVCTVIFFAAVLVKIGGFYEVSEMVLARLEEGIRVEAVFEALGMDITEKNITQAVADVFNNTFEEPAKKLEVIDNTESVPAIEEIPTPPMDMNGTVLIEEPLEFTLSYEDTDDTTNPEGFRVPPPDIVSEEAVSMSFGHTAPVFGHVTSEFGYRDHPIDGETKFHYGIDIGAREGTKILAFADGVVGDVLKGNINGNYFKIAHSNKIVSMYAHCQKITVKKGQKVKKGDVIAYVGKTGQVSGAHLHFQLYKDGKIIDPTEFIEASA